jgi:sugar phosphate permease
MKERPNLLLTISAVVYFAAAIPLLFAPDEILSFAGAAPSALAAGLLQVVGSAVFGFSMLNWASRYTRTGGIYGRPLVIANLAHTASAALLLARAAARGGWPAGAVVPLGIYAVLAVGFGMAMFSRPRSPEGAKA